MGKLLVSCVNRNDSPDAHARVEGIGGLCPDTGRRWYMAANEAIACILGESHEFVVVVGSREVPVVVDRRPGGLLSLKTSIDGQRENNLLLRPQCPL